MLSFWLLYSLPPIIFLFFFLPVHFSPSVFLWDFWALVQVRLYNAALGVFISFRSKDELLGYAGGHSAMAQFPCFSSLQLAQLLVSSGGARAVPSHTEHSRSSALKTGQPCATEHCSTELTGTGEPLVPITSSRAVWLKLAVLLVPVVFHSPF